MKAHLNKLTYLRILKFVNIRFKEVYKNSMLFWVYSFRYQNFIFTYNSYTVWAVMNIKILYTFRLGIRSFESTKIKVAVCYFDCCGFFFNLAVLPEFLLLAKAVTFITITLCSFVDLHHPEIKTDRLGLNIYGYELAYW